MLFSEEHHLAVFKALVNVEFEVGGKWHSKNDFLINETHPETSNIFSSLGSAVV